MKYLKHPTMQWGLPIVVLLTLFWLSLFCYSAIPISGTDAFNALLPGHTPSFPEALVRNLRLPRSLVAILVGASLALAGTLLQTLTHNPMSSPSLLGINSGAALTMALTSALSPMPVAGYSLSFVAACGGENKLFFGNNGRRRVSSYSRQKQIDPCRYSIVSLLHGPDAYHPASG